MRTIQNITENFKMMLVSLLLFVPFFLMGQNVQEAYLSQNVVTAMVIKNGKIQAAEQNVNEMVIFKEALKDHTFPFEVNKEVLVNLKNEKSGRDIDVKFSKDSTYQVVSRIDWMVRPIVLNPNKNQERPSFERTIPSRNELDFMTVSTNDKKKLPSSLETYVRRYQDDSKQGIAIKDLDLNITQKDMYPAVTLNL